MTIPPPPHAHPEANSSAVWNELNPDEKRARLLEVGGEFFAREGLGAPMPTLAAAAGIGVGSLYRAFPSKRELLTALLVERLEEVTAEAQAALADPVGPWEALTAFMRKQAEQAVADDVMAEALARLKVDPTVARVRVRATSALRRLVDAAVASGEMREDATVLDVRLVFAGVRAAESVETGAWRRALELGISSLIRQRQDSYEEGDRDL
jgi:AcrR family transcriptional regulator